MLERERIAVAINTARQSSSSHRREKRYLVSRQSSRRSIARWERCCHREPSAAFDVLKDSDVEQFQLDDFAGGANNVAPVSEADKKAILYTKLVYRQQFRQVLADSRFMRDDLVDGGRQMAFAEVRRALEASRDSYLQEVRQYLYKTTSSSRCCAITNAPRSMTNWKSCVAWPTANDVRCSDHPRDETPFHPLHVLRVAVVQKQQMPLLGDGAQRIYRGPAAQGQQRITGDSRVAARKGDIESRQRAYPPGEILGDIRRMPHPRVGAVADDAAIGEVAGLEPQRH